MIASIPRSSVAVPFVLVAVLAACSGRPSVEEVVDRSSPVICEKAKECSGELTFSTAYPGGVDECVTKTKDASKKKYGDDLNKSSVCTDEELDKCLQDLKAATCPADKSLPPVPCDC
ncbi:MAG: hypothetical protein KF764_09380 [Labilithrix sp.]|nr:hypothetical protein [Labilithrix sp.]MBX3224436.1 hypothetical protein [Labilithrix sp.]